MLLLDEPASGLDPEARASLAQLMRQLQAQGMTLIVSSHILSELDEYCTHILALRAGRIENHGPLHTTRASPEADEQQLFALELAAPLTAQWLDCLQGLEIQSQPPHAPVLLWLPTAAEQRAALVAHWVQQGVPLASLVPQRESLQQRYQRTVEGPSAHA